MAVHTNPSSPNTHLNTTDPVKLHLPVTSNETHDKAVDKDASIDIITPPRPPPEPPPVEEALKCQLENNNDTDSRSTTDMSYLSDWLDQANKAEADDTLVVEDEMVNDSSVTLAAERWSDSAANKTTVNEEPSDSSFPKGSLLNRPPSPTSAIDWSRHIYKDFNTPLTEEHLNNPSVNRISLDTSPMDLSPEGLDLSPEGLDEILEDYKNDTVVSIGCKIRAIGLEGDPTVLQTIEWDKQIAETFGYDDKKGELIDGGANICMTDDRSKLVNIRSIPPVTIGLAEANKSTVRTECTEMGYLPLTREDGLLHYQPVLINNAATDTILSPNAVLQSSRDLVKWTQTGFRDSSQGLIQFFDSHDNPKITMKLDKVRGLYYSNHQSYCVDSNPIRTHCSKVAIQDFITRHEDVTDDDSSVNPMIDAVQSLHISRVQMNSPPLPTLSEEKPFEPILDFLSEVPFDEESPMNSASVYAVKNASTPPPKKTPYRRRPVEPAKQLESELWAARLGFCGSWQLDVIPACAKGLPNHFDYHPLRFIDHKEQARIRRQAAHRTVERVKGRGQRFYIDYGFIRASTSDFSRPKEDEDRVVQSYDGFNSYLAVIDEHSRMAWVYLMTSKEPPIEEMSAHLEVFGLKNGGLLRCDQGGELARSEEFRTEMQKRHGYKVEPTGADAPNQNGGVERWNETFAVTVRALLYGASLPAEYWSDALRHAVYLHNRRVHKTTKRTPFEGWHGEMPDLSSLRTFGSRVCVKRTGKRRAKLDMHDFTGLFLGYTATDNNIIYLDLDSGVVKSCPHAKFDEAWYLQPSRPPAAQLLYNLGLVTDSDFEEEEQVVTVPCAYPPIPKDKVSLFTPRIAKQTPLPLRMTATPRSIAAAAAKAELLPKLDPYADTVLATRDCDGNVVEEYDITMNDVQQIYCSPHPYNDAFEVEMGLQRFNSDIHPTAGIKFKMINKRLIVSHMEVRSPAARIPRWRTGIRGAWLRQIGDVVVETVKDVKRELAKIKHVGRRTKVKLVLSHPEIKHGLTNNGIPQCNIDQLNPRRMLEEFDMPDITNENDIRQEFDGDVFNFVSTAMKLTRGALMKKEEQWHEWQQSEFKQLDQYYEQGMFGEPVKITDKSAVFNLVWTYVIKELDKRKKARCTCDGSTRAGQVRVLDHTYANCVDQTGSRIFYALSAAENKIIFGADVSNAFAEAPAPKQGFYIRPDKAFRDWWTIHRGLPDIPPGYVIPVLSAMQGHPESPRLWEKHADKILRELGLRPTVHEPCLYSGIINGERVLFKRQVDDFAVATDTEATANILFDMIDEKLTFPLKRMGKVTMFNGIDVLQTRDYIKISVQTYLERICEKHLRNWMNLHKMPNRPTPLPTRDEFMKSFLSAIGSKDEKVQAELAKKYTFGYRSGIGELIYAMITCRPDLSYATVAAAQHSANPAECHYNGVRHILKYAYLTRTDGLYFWRPEPNSNLDYVEPPEINSAMHDLLADGRPKHNPLEAHAFMDATWASCLKTRRSFGGMCVRLAGGTIAYKAWLQATVALSSTESEFISASDTGKVLLYIRSILYDLGVPQDAATIAYEDNDACTAMANAQKPTSRTRHIDTRYHALCEWVERDLIKLERVDTSRNMADHFTKQLSATLFNRHVDYILGKVPPHYSECYKKIKELTTQLKPRTLKKKEYTQSVITPPTSALPNTQAAAAKVCAKLCSTWYKIIRRT